MYIYVYILAIRLTAIVKKYLHLVFNQSFFSDYDFFFRV